MPFDNPSFSEEEVRMQRLRLVVDGAAHCVLHGRFSLQQVEALIEETRAKVLKLFPDRGDLFDLLYRPRLMRLFQDWG